MQKLIQQLVEWSGQKVVIPSVVDRLDSDSFLFVCIIRLNMLTPFAYVGDDGRQTPAKPQTQRSTCANGIIFIFDSRWIIFILETDYLYLRDDCLYRPPYLRVYLGSYHRLRSRVT